MHAAKIDAGVLELKVGWGEELLGAELLLFEGSICRRESLLQLEKLLKMLVKTRGIVVGVGGAGDGAKQCERWGWRTQAEVPRCLGTEGLAVKPSMPACAQSRLPIYNLPHLSDIMSHHRALLSTASDSNSCGRIARSRTLIHHTSPHRNSTAQCAVRRLIVHGL